MGVKRKTDAQRSLEESARITKENADRFVAFLNKEAEREKRKEDERIKARNRDAEERRRLRESITKGQLEAARALDKRGK